PIPPAVGVVLRAPASPLFPYTTLFRSVAGGQHHDRHRALRSEPLADFEPVEPRQGDVEDDEVGILACEEVECLLPVPGRDDAIRSEEHTSELQSRGHLVCRLLLENTK